jgi:hypothetical protein
MTYPMEENNPKGKYKVKHKSHRITDYIPSGHIMKRHDNIRHMTYRRRKVIRVDKIIQIA